DKLQAGKYSILAERHGYPSQGYDSHEQYGTAIVTGAGQDTEHLIFRLKPAASIIGRAVDHFGEPLRDASVLLFYAGPIDGKQSVRHVVTEKTDDLGVYRIQGLPAGKYFVAVQAKPWFRGMAEMDPNASGDGEHH